MKNVELKTQKDEKLEGKVFTKNDVKGIIKKDQNPLYKGFNSFFKRGGLCMEENKVILKEVKKKLNWKEKIFVSIFPKTYIKLYRIGMADCFNYYNKNSTF